MWSIKLCQALEKPETTHVRELVTVTEDSMCGASALLEDGRIVLSEDGLTQEALDRLPESALFRENMNPRPSIVVCGAGSVGQCVIRLARFLKWNVTAIDDRLDFCRLAEAAGADRTVLNDYETALSEDALYGKRNAFVIMTRGHRYDHACLQSIFSREECPAYIGMMSSRARAARMRQMLKEDGFSDRSVQALHAPVGLAIGSQTPEEIALSIIAQIMQERSGQANDAGAEQADPNVVAAVLEVLEHGRHPAVLATIVRCQGSTPRKAGARMLIRRGQPPVGTIGGGCMEAEVIREAEDLLLEAAAGVSARPVRVDLTGRSGRSADMLCGGAMDVLLQTIVPSVLREAPSSV